MHDYDVREELYFNYQIHGSGVQGPTVRPT